MTTYNTMNPVPSADARDRYDNSQVFDELMNGPAPSTPDRLGVLRQSWAGMEAAFAGSETDRAEAFQTFLANSGWSSLGAYGVGIQIISHSQTVDYQGQPYQLKSTVPASLDAPYVTTGNWSVEGVNFKLVGDTPLRQELGGSTSPNGGAALIGRAVVSVPSVFALCQLGSYRADATYAVAAWQAAAGVSALRGGGNFIYLPTLPKARHNGGYIISPTVPITSAVASTPAFLAGTGETDPGGLGCLVRIELGEVYAEQFGLIDDPTYSWNCKSFNAAIKWVDASGSDISPGVVWFMDGEFRTTDPVILWRQNGQTGRIPGFRGAGPYNSTIIKTTNNTAGSQFGTFNLDAAVIEIPKTGDDLQIGGADSGSFGLRKLAGDRTGYGYYAARSYFGKRTNMMIRDFNYGFSSPGCWMQQVDFIWCLGCNVNFTMSGTSNFGGNLYSGHAYEIGFDLSGLTYSNLSAACDSTGEQGTTPKVAYRIAGSHGLKLTCGVEKTVGEEFNISSSFGVEINGHSFSTGVSTVITQKVSTTNSTVKMTFDWNSSMGNLTPAQKAFYPKLFIKDVRSSLDFTGSNFGDTDPRMPRVLDGNCVANVEISPHRNTDGMVTHRMNLSSTVYKQAIYVGSSKRFKLEGGLCADGTADIQFEPTVALGHAVSAVGTTEATATDIGNLYIDGVLNAGRLKGYVSGGWLYLLGVVGQQRGVVLKFFTAPLA